MDLIPEEKKVETAVNNIRKLVQEMKKRFEGNEQVIELMAACATAQQPVLILGQPGTGKTTMATTFLELTGLKRGEVDGFFEKSFHPYIELSDVFGPLDFKKLRAEKEQRSEYVRLVEGYLPSVRAAFLDDIFSASPDFLLTLLSILENRIYFNGPKVYPSPLSIIFAASNDLPSDEKLSALRNRLPIRVVTDEINDVEMRARMLRKSNQIWYERVRARTDGKAAMQKQICSFDDFTTCSARLLFNVVPGDFETNPFVKQYVECLDCIAKNPAQIAIPNARSQQKFYEVMRALSLLRREEPDPTSAELRVLEFMFENSSPETRNSLHHELNQQSIPEWEPIPLYEERITEVRDNFEESSK